MQPSIKHVFRGTTTNQKQFDTMQKKEKKKLVGQTHIKK